MKTIKKYQSVPLNSDLVKIAFNIRKHAILLSMRGSCFLGSALSAVDILVALYSSVFNFDPSNPNDPNRDKCVLSKGHAVPAIYGLLVELGVLFESDLEKHIKPESLIYWHPNERVPGIDVSTGSLGQGFSVASGLAYGAKVDASSERVYVIIGDGEIQEGVIWENALFASKYKLGNLITIIDRNKFQANMATEKLMPIEPLRKKWEAFCWEVHCVDGHNIEQIRQVLLNIPLNSEKPHVIIAETTRGKGVPSIEGRPDKWIVKSTEKDVAKMIEELEKNQP
mgnify:CR=1 FL=1